MRAAAFVAVVLFAACADGDRVDTDPIARTPTGGIVSPGRGAHPGDEVVDLDLFPFEGGSPVAVADRVGTPCDLGDAELQSFADENLGCGTCYAMACGGEVAAHVCTHACDELPSD